MVPSLFTVMSLIISIEKIKGIYFHFYQVVYLIFFPVYLNNNINMIDNILLNLRNMKTKLLLGSIVVFVMLLMISSATAVPCVNSQYVNDVIERI